ncbi:MAG: 1,6-anhydro-N-acetylmuramyl-L-alanine amidase AmpD [Methylococcaceae bacterium]
MKINKSSGLLDSATYIPSPNCDDRPSDEMTLTVIHNISLPPGQFGNPYITQLFTNKLDPKEHEYFEEIYELRVSSHLLIGRKAEIVQYVPFHKRAWHAGVSTYLGRSVCNDFSIGIELEGTDDTDFTESQYQALVEVLKALVVTYPKLNMEHITGHEHIAPGRKTDPGPHFDWDRVGRACQADLPAKAAGSDTVCD